MSLMCCMDAGEVWGEINVTIGEFTGSLFANMYGFPIGKLYMRVCSRIGGHRNMNNADQAILIELIKSARFQGALANYLHVITVE